MRKLLLAFFILLLPYAANAAVSIFPCESRPAAGLAASAHDADQGGGAICTHNCVSHSCDELDEPSPSDHLDLVDGLSLSAPAELAGTLSFPPPHAPDARAGGAPLKPPPTR